jgi:hypothetical protein
VIAFCFGRFAWPWFRLTFELGITSPLFGSHVELSPLQLFQIVR